MQKLLITILLAFFLCRVTNAQTITDTLRIKLADAEKMFIDSNYQLLAQKYNINAQKALEIQARLYPNPNLSVERGPIIPLHNPDYPHSNFFNQAETSVQLSQLILLAGKRNKQIKLAEANSRLSEFQFFDLMRTLKYTLRTDFFNIYYLQKSSAVYNEEITALQKVVSAFVQQEGKGYISEKEVVRIKAQLYSLQNEYGSLISQIADQESELKLVLQVKPGEYIVPVVDAANIIQLDPNKYSLSTLIDSAYKNRTDLQIARANTEINRLNLNYQKSLAVPDVTLSASYDRQGSYATNFQAIGASIDLPFFNRNQGNIKSAKAMTDYSNAMQKSTEATVNENVANALQKAFIQDRLFKNIDPKFLGDFERLMQEVLSNYQKRNVSILDFLDFYDSYKQNALQSNAIEFNRLSAFEDINFYTGTNFFN
ncbi:MAG: TolC family protein [Bacteroidetes bacterium]|nr:TolC family protein [Bacteroidota bacterium]MBS1973604.1 TolC family protein [Bacteroidota bacterium]